MRYEFLSSTELIWRRIFKRYSTPAYQKEALQEYLQRGDAVHHLSTTLQQYVLMSEKVNFLIK